MQEKIFSNFLIAKEKISSKCGYVTLKAVDDYILDIISDTEYLKLKYDKILDLYLDYIIYTTKLVKFDINKATREELKKIINNHINSDAITLKNEALKPPKKYKIIELFNLIANYKPVPSYVKYNDEIYLFCKPCLSYERVKDNEPLYYLFDTLNDEVIPYEEENHEVRYVDLSDVKLAMGSNNLS